MKFWEGAVIVVGGIWLIGRISRSSPDHPINVASASNQNLSGVSSGVDQSGATTSTNTDGSSSLVSGETLSPAPPIIGSGVTPMPAPTVPIMSTPDPGCSACGGVVGSFPIPLLPSRTKTGGFVSMPYKTEIAL